VKLKISHQDLWNYDGDLLDSEDFLHHLRLDLKSQRENMIVKLNTKYAHTNLVARDWKSLAKFYIDVFGCKPKPPERDLNGKWLDDVTSLRDAHVKGIHLHLPGSESDGPTLEVFQYTQMTETDPHKINRPGFAHIAFAVENVQEALEEVIRHGGGKIGELVSTEIKGAGKIDFVYACDPEGNIVELQNGVCGNPLP
jgi:predicted enzyme related to lactoylglutathione lyase